MSEDDIIPLQAPIITSPSAGQQITSQALSVTLSALDVPANQLVTVTIGSSGPIYVMANAAGRISTVLSLSTFPDGAITITITTIASQSSSVTVTKNAVNAIYIYRPTDFEYIVNNGRANDFVIDGFGNALASVYVVITDSVGTQITTASTVITVVGTWSITTDISSLAEGPITLLAYSVDTLGNPVTSQTVTVILDTVVSTAVLTPVNGEYVGAAEVGSLVIAGTGEAGGVVLILVSSGNSIFSVDIDIPSSGLWTTTVNIASFPDGNVKINGTSSDPAGNSADLPDIIIIKDTVIGSFTLTAPTAGSYINQDNAGTVTISGTGEPGASVSVRIYDEQMATMDIVTMSVTIDGLGMWSTTTDVTSQSDGFIYFVGTIIDLATNTQDTLPVSVNLDTVDPNAPTILVPIASSFVNSLDADQLIIDGTGEPFATIAIDIADSGSQISLPTTVVQPDGSWAVSADVTSLLDETLTISVRQTDLAGNLSPDASVQVIKDTQAPTSLTINPISTVNDDQSSAVIIGGSNAEAGTQIDLILESGVTVTTTGSITSGSDWETAPFAIASLDYGNVQVTVTETDPAGNSFSVITSFDFVQGTCNSDALCDLTETYLSCPADCAAPPAMSMNRQAVA